MTGKKFLAYVEQCLAPTLMRKEIVGMDNLPAHKAAGIREPIHLKPSEASNYFRHAGLKHSLHA